MAELGWKDAIVKALEKGKEPMHYTDIAQAIATEGMKKKFGATPAASVAATISMSLQNDGEETPFIKVSRGVYALKTLGRSRQMSLSRLLKKRAILDSSTPLACTGKGIAFSGRKLRGFWGNNNLSASLWTSVLRKGSICSMTGAK